MTRVLVAAASPVVRAGLFAVLAESGRVEVAGAGVDLESLPAALAREQPQVMLLCVSGEAEEALVEDLLATESDRPPAPPCVCLTGHPDAAWIREHLGETVRGVLPLDAEPVEIVAAIEAAAAGLTTFPSEDVASLLGGRGEPESFRSPPGTTRALSPREVEVLQMIAEGLPNKTIAARLSISEHTVKFHVASILEKLGAESRTEAVTRGLRTGVIFL